MNGKWIRVDGGEMFVRFLLQENNDKASPTILFVHGLGESGACFAEAVQWLKNYNLIIPDLLGFGHSAASADGDHSTIAQAKRIVQLLEHLDLKRVALIGHSWGGAVGTIVCSLAGDIIQHYLNVEGDLHLDNVAISYFASKVFRLHDQNFFREWLWEKGFKDMILSWCSPAAIRYFSSVRLCVPQVFGETSEEIAGRCQTADLEGIIEWGHLFASLPLPKVYCWGTKSLPDDSFVIKFLEKNGIEHKSFEGASHWLMQDKAAEFYQFVQSRVAM